MVERWIGFAVALAAGALHAQPDVAVPVELEGWRDWVLHEKEYRRCPFRFDSAATAPEDFVCAWPGELQLEVDDQEGRFEQAWTVYGGSQWLPLPGGTDVWPQQVSAGGRALEVVLRDGTPGATLAAGEHEISGRFGWDERPATLAVPTTSGLVSLTVDGVRIRLPTLDARGLWLGDVEPTARVPDSLVVDVYRRVIDEVPTRLDTLIRLDVAGTVREEVLSPALPVAFTPLALASDLPAVLQPDGSLRLQARPGEWEVVVTARADEVLTEVGLPTTLTNMPAEEIWSFQPVPNLRAAVAEAARPVDPTQVGSPWTELPTFRIEAGGVMTVDERQRGLADTDNEIRLSRRLWLDFDGAGFVFSDRVSGRMRSDWRLDMAAPYALLGATEHGADLQVTASGAGAGIEVRQAGLGIEALGRVETRGRMPVLGWESDFESIAATLHVPPGHKLLAAAGVDAAPASWVGRWRVLDFFVLLIVTVATVRLFGRGAGAVALLALVLSYHEPGAPVWTWLNLLAAVALVRVAPAGRLQRLARSYRLVSLAVLVLWLVPFAIGQIRISVYPQLQTESHRTAPNVGLFEALSGEMEFAPSPAARETVVLDNIGVETTKDLGDVVFDTVFQQGVNATAATRASYSRYPDDALVQAGTAKPDWSWISYELQWSGPVDSGRTMRLVIAPNWLVAFLRFAMIASLAAFAALFALEMFGGRCPDWRRWLRSLRGAPVATVALLAAASLDTGGPAFAAQTPSPEILDELERRLLAAPPCAPRCAEIADAYLDVGEETASMRLIVHALATVAVPLPGSDDGWRPARVASDGSDLPATRDENGVLWIHLDPGVHTLVVSGPLPTGDAVEIPFSLTPRAIRAESAHWAVAGIENRTLSAGSLNLTRLASHADVDAAAWEPSRLPTFVAVERTIGLDLDWQVGTLVRRIAPEVGAINTVIPLIEGESVVSEQSLTNDGAVVSMGPTQDRVSWTSTLPRTATVSLQARVDPPWQEIWRVRIGHMWQVAFEGVPESNVRQGTAERRVEFHPRPGESLVLHITRPEAVEGRTLAFDRVRAKTAVGSALRRTTLAVDYRSTRGGTHRLGLPADARLRSVAIDGETHQIALDGGAVELPILPGEHRATLDFEQTASAATRVSTPVIDLDAPSSNIVVGLEMPESRWLLFATGPLLGPAILYWSELIALVIVALLLGLLKVTPLRWWHWLLLGLGFSTFSWPALAIVALWLVGFGAREAWGAGLTRFVYNVSQVALGLLTLLAFAAILVGIPAGLLGNPDMHVTGFQSSGHNLNWFADQSATTTPAAAVWSLPMWSYKALILAWALWLSFALVRWLPWVWGRFAARGMWVAAPEKEEPEKEEPAK